MKQSTQATRKKLNYKIHFIVCFFIVCLAAVYVWKVNHQAQYSYEIKKLENKKSELLDSIHDKRLSFESARSLSVIARRADDLGFDKPEDVTFLKIGLSAVAVEYDKHQE